MLAILALFACLYRMFDYVITWGSGWQDLPSAAPLQRGFVDPAWSATATAADAELRATIEAMRAPAVSAAVFVAGRRVWASAIGWADIELQLPATIDASFRLGSTSKAINSMALGTLLDQGRIDLDAPLRTYLPEISETLGALTTRQAISHTAGVRDYGVCLCFPIWEQFNRREFGSTARAGLSVFADDALLFKPGSQFAYSSFGTNLAGAAVEAVSEMDYMRYVQKAVFDPLAMRDSGPDTQQRRPNRVQFYDVQEGRYKTAYPVNNSIKWPSGGMISTPSDLLLIGQAMLNASLFSAPTRDLLIQVQHLSDGSANEQGYALGWRYTDDKNYLTIRCARACTAITALRLAVSPTSRSTQSLDWSFHSWLTKAARVWRKSPPTPIGSPSCLLANSEVRFKSAYD